MADRWPEFSGQDSSGVRAGLREIRAGVTSRQGKDQDKETLELGHIRKFESVLSWCLLVLMSTYLS